MHVPLTSLFEPNYKFQEAKLSIVITALAFFGLMELNMRRRRRHTHGDLAQGVNKHSSAKGYFNAHVAATHMHI